MPDSTAARERPTPPRFYSVAATARILGVSAMTLYRLIAENEFPAIRIRNRLIVPASVIDEMAQAAADSKAVVDASDWAARPAMH